METQAPTGYIPLAGAIKILVNDTVTALKGMDVLDVSQVGDSHRVNGPGQYDSTWQITVENTPGIQLPSTGGPGAVFYTAAGLSLMSIALWMFFRRRHLIRHNQGN